MGYRYGFGWDGNGKWGYGWTFCPSRDERMADISQQSTEYYKKGGTNKMAMTAAEIKTMYHTSPDTIAHELGRILRDFGYPNATDEAVKAELKAQIEDGAEPSNLSYGLWIQTYLRDGID